MKPARALRNLLDSGRIATAPGVMDPLSARLLEQLGFECLYLGGNALGTGLCVGQPFVTLTETADAVHRITANIDVPLIVDAGAGFGDAAHVRRTVRELEHAGAAAIHIDDQIYPKRAHYHRGRGRLDSGHVVADKLREAVAARRDPAFAIWARTDALRVFQSVDAVIERALAFAQAGADGVVLLDAGPTEVAAVRAALQGIALVYIGGIKEPVPTAAQLHAAGFAAALYPFNTVAAMANAVVETWAGFRDTGRPRQPAVPTHQSVAAMLELVGMPHYWAIEERTTERPA